MTYQLPPYVHTLVPGKGIGPYVSVLSGLRSTIELSRFKYTWGWRTGFEPVTQDSQSWMLPLH
jgi:hypothetical protein